MLDNKLTYKKSQSKVPFCKWCIIYASDVNVLLGNSLNAGSKCSGAIWV